MKILHVIHSVDPRSGGPSNSLRELVRVQRAAGDEVRVITTSIQSAESWTDHQEYRRQVQREWDEVPLRVVGSFFSRPSGAMRRYGYSSEAVAALRENMDVDVVHVHGLFSHLTMKACRIARKAGVPYIVRPAGGLNPECFAQGSVGKRVLHAVQVRKDLERAAVIHATSEREQEILRGQFPGANVVCIPHGVMVPNESTMKEAREAFLAQHPEFRGRRILLSLSRFHRKKRISELIRSFAAVASDDWVLLAAGTQAGDRDGVLAAARNAGPGRVLVTDFLCGKEKAGALAAAEAVALISTDENFGLFVTEGMANGCAVLVAEGVDSKVYVESSGCGFVVDADLQDLRPQLAELLKADVAAMGERGRTFAARHLSWEGVAAELRGVYPSAGKSGL